MYLKMWESLLPELSEVRARLEDEMQLKSGHVSRLMEWEPYDLKKMFPVILVLLVSRMFGKTTRQGSYMANVVQFIQMATHIHRTVPEEGTNIPEADRKAIPFSVLVGDLLYGQFFVFLCKGEILKYLEPLSEAICRIHEGAMIRKELVESGFALDEHVESMRELEFASLPAVACRLTGELSGASSEQLLALERLGQAIGLLASHHITKAPASQLNVWMRQALDALEELPRGTMVEACRTLLSQLSGQSWNDHYYATADGTGMVCAGHETKLVV